MKALTIGGAMIDTIAIIDSGAIERMSLMNAGSSFLLLEEGRKTEAIEVSTHCGGGGINVSISLSRLGFDSSVLMKLGRDRRAEQILARLDEEGVSHRWALLDDVAPTGASVHVSSHDRDAAVFTFRGANTLLDPADLYDDAFDVDLVYVANLSNEAAHCFSAITEKAKSKRAVVAANPGIRQLHDHGGAFQASLDRLDILVLNRREADEVVSMLDTRECSEHALDFPQGVDQPALAVRGLRHESRRMGVRSFCRSLMARGVGAVVLTDGRDGAFAAAEDRLIYCPAHMVDSVAGTAGAGDAFGSTYSAFSAGGNPPDVALRAAAINAAAVLGHVDTQTGLMRRSDLQDCLVSRKPTPSVMSWDLYL
jgi:ribokinase